MMYRDLYCSICGGPTTNLFHDKDSIVERTEENHDPPTLEEIPGVSYEDRLWLSESAVAIYADCITPPGQYGNPTSASTSSRH
jgi:hypothetical protein